MKIRGSRPELSFESFLVIVTMQNKTWEVSTLLQKCPPRLKPVKDLPGLSCGPLLGAWGYPVLRGPGLKLGGALAWGPLAFNRGRA